MVVLPEASRARTLPRMSTTRSFSLRARTSRTDCGMRNAECGMEVASFGARTDPGDSLAVDQHGGVLEHLEVRHFTTTAGTGRSAARHDLPGADEEGLQACASPSRIGRRIPWRRAVSMAWGYPASAWRATPIPGSFVSTRSSRRPADGDPSATLTCPACSELPMPTPPP